MRASLRKSCLNYIAGVNASIYMHFPFLVSLPKSQLAQSASSSSRAFGCAPAAAAAPPHAEPKNSRACSDFVAHSPRAQRFTPNSVNHALTYPNVAPRMRNFDLADKRATGYYIQRALLLL